LNQFIAASGILPRRPIFGIYSARGRSEAMMARELELAEK